MHDAGELPAEVSLHGDHHPPVALGQQLLLGDTPPHRVRQGRAGVPLQARLRPAQLAAHRRQLGARVIIDVPSRRDRLPHLRDERPEVCDHLRDRGDARRLLRQPLGQLPGSPGCIERASRLLQVGRLDRLSDRGRLDEGSQIAHPAEGDIEPHLLDAGHLGGVRLQRQHGFVVPLRLQRERQLPSQAEGGFARQHGPYLVELQHAQGVVVHGPSVRFRSQRDQRRERRTRFGAHRNPLS